MSNYIIAKEETLQQNRELLILWVYATNYNSKILLLLWQWIVLKGSANLPRIYEVTSSTNILKNDQTTLSMQNK